MVGISVFMSTFPIVYAATTGVLMLIFLLRVQMRLEPYKYGLNNKLEIEAMVTGTATLFSGVLFTSDDSSLALVVLLVLVIILVLNIRYFLFWLFCMSFTLVERHELFRASFNMLAFITCRRKLARQMIEKSGIVLLDHFSTVNAEKNNQEIASIAKKPVARSGKTKKRNQKLNGIFKEKSKKNGKKVYAKNSKIKLHYPKTSIVNFNDSDVIVEEDENSNISQFQSQQIKLNNEKTSKMDTKIKKVFQIHTTNQNNSMHADNSDFDGSFNFDYNVAHAPVAIAKTKPDKKLSKQNPLERKQNDS